MEEPCHPPPQLLLLLLVVGGAEVLQAPALRTCCRSCSSCCRVLRS
jgi:hypothetical protein